MAHHSMSKLISCVLIVTMSLLPVHGYEDQAKTGRDAQTFGLEMAAEFEPSSYSDGNIHLGGAQAINVNELFPGTSNTNSVPSSYYFPDGLLPDTGKLEDIHNDNEGMDTVGGDAKSSLWSDANSDNPTISGAAYKVLLDASNQSKPDFSNDPIMGLSKATYDEIDLISEGFGDCSSDTIITESTVTSRVPEYFTCDRLYKPAGDCTITHSIEIVAEPADVVFLIDNSGSMGGVIHDLRNNVGAFAQLLTQDGSGDLRLGGAVYRHSDYTFNRSELTPDFDTFEAWLETVSAASAPTYPFDAIAWAANHYQWREGGIRRVLVLVGNDDFAGDQSAAISALAANNVDLFTFHNNGLVKSIGTPLADYFSGPLLLKFAQDLTVVAESWTPTSCVESGIATLEEFCSGSYSATPETDESCVILSGFQVCEGDPVYQRLGTPPLPNVPKLAARVDVTQLDCTFNHGRGSCWIDKDGNEQCLENHEDVDQCAQYEDNPQCGFVSSTCVDGAMGSEGNCYVREDTFDCGYDVDVPTLEKDTEFSCGGPIKCMGNDCLDIEKTTSTDFARASALMNAAQFMTQDMSCEDVTGEDNTYCTAFAGTEGWCKKAVGGAQDCCEKPGGISMADYLALVMSVPKLDGAIMALENGSLVKGAYQAIRDPVVSGWSEITKPFTSYMENVSGAVDSFTQPIQDFAADTVNALKEQITEITGEALGNASTSAGSTAATAATEDAAEEATQELLSEQAASILNGIMTVYTVYVVTMLVIQLVWECEEIEFETNAKRALESCHHVGSYCADDVLGVCIEKREAYCCFSSPLSKIIQREIRPQLGLTFGSPRSPSCEGIPLDRLAEIDWSQVDLDEWIGLLQQHGQFNDPTSLDMEQLTGEGSVFNTDGTRLNAQERTEARLEGVDLEEIRRDASQSILLDKGAGN